MNGLCVLLVLLFLSPALGQNSGEPDLKSCLLQLSCADHTELAKACHRTKFEFPTTGQTTDWIRLKVPIPSLSEITLCFWVTPRSLSSSTAKSILSYATRREHNALLVEITQSKLNVLFNGNSKAIELSVANRTHLCVVAEPSQGRAQIFVNGIAKPRMAYPSKSSIEGGGSLLIGQEQDAFMDRLDADQAFAGILENLMIWYSPLSGSEIYGLYSYPCLCPRGNDIAFTPDQIQIAGKVGSLPVDRCQ